MIWYLVLYLSATEHGGPVAIEMAGEGSCRAGLMNAQESIYADERRSFCINTSTGQIVIYATRN